MRKTEEEKLLSLIQGTLRLESLHHGRTLLQDFHCPDHFAAQGIFGVNHYVGGDITLQTPGKAEKHVPKGCAILIPAGMPLKYINNRPGKTTSIWHGLQFSILDTIDPLTLLDMPLVINADAGRKVGDINKELTGIQPLASVNFLDYIVRRHSLGMRLFEIVLSFSSLKPDAHAYLQLTERIQPALQYIKANLDKPLCTGELASVLHVSAPRFFEVFREAQQMSPGQYIQQLRLRKAQELLMNSDLLIHEVATATGYADQFHFSRLFKKKFKTSPDLFRKTWRGP